MSATDLVPIGVAARLLGVSPITLRRREARRNFLRDARILGNSRRYNHSRSQAMSQSDVRPKGGG